MKIQWNKVTWYSKIVAVILGIGIFVLGIYIGVVYQKGVDVLDRSDQQRVVSPAPIKKAVVAGQGKQYEYIQEGYIKNNATGDAEIDDWVLVNEKPGEAALATGIIFMTSSRCITGQRVEICNPAAIEQGQRVRVTGHTDATGKIIVERLEML